jgi:hypothetical protein
MGTRRVVVVFISLLVPLSWMLVSPAPALAACPNGFRHVQAWTNDTNGSENHFGTKAATGIWVPPSPPTPQCVRVSSIFTVAGGEQVEIGWIMDPTRYGCADYPLNGTVPRQLVAYYHNGQIHCPMNGTPDLWNPSGDYQSANVYQAKTPASCSPTDNRWVWEVGGNQVHQEVDTLSFCSGKSIANGERFPPETNAKSDFQGLKVLGSGGGWLSWTDAHVCYDDDGSFDVIFHDQAGHVGVDSDPPDDSDLSPCYNA